MKRLSLYLFQRSLRLYDNIGFYEAIKSGDEIIPIFIFTPEQIMTNSYKSNNSIQFMIESLNDLNQELKKYKSKLQVFYGNISNILQDIFEVYDINNVFCNKDYTLYACIRENNIIKICDKYNIKYNSYEDILLFPVGSVLTTTGSIYYKFTPFYNNASNKKIQKPLKYKIKNLSNINIKNEYVKNICDFVIDTNTVINGGRNECFKLLNEFKYSHYSTKRDILTYTTSRMSAYLKFGCISIRELYWKISNKDFRKQLFWREFYTNIGYYNKENIFNGKALREKYDIKWVDNKTYFNAWKNGKTGYPIVDAGMRELNNSGYMHNRSRLICSSFLVKNLIVDWRKGEQYFATKLVDYDPIINNGNWMWVASVGTDSQPYFRIFNPWLQSIKYDPDCEYIKKWLPELKDVENKHIHKWYDYYNEYNTSYPKPIVDYTYQKNMILRMYKNK